MRTLSLSACACMLALALSACGKSKKTDLAPATSALSSASPTSQTAQMFADFYNTPSKLVQQARQVTQPDEKK